MLNHDTPEGEQQTLQTIHAANFQALCAFDAFCSSHGLHYTLHYGTLLGAVRHADFIPWDDDVDLAMPRTDFDRLCALLRDDPPADFCYVPTCYKRQFLDFIPRFTNPAVTVRSVHEQGDFYGGLLAHPGIDIFVQDTACTGLRRKLQLLRLKLCYGMAMGFRASVSRENYHGLVRLGAAVLPALGRRLGLERIARRYEAISRCAGKDTGRVFLSNAVPFYLPKTYDVAWFAETTTLSLCGRSFPVPQGYDALLHCLYGDYMQLPPPEQRHPEHLLELEAPAAQATEQQGGMVV